MTRQEEIIQDAIKEFPRFAERRVGFIAGAEWADAHPNWISVKDYATDELPPLMNEKDPYGESAQVLFVVVLDGVQYINKGTFDYDTGVWHSLEMQCSFFKEQVTHWMPMPEPPVVSQSGNAHIIGSEEHIKVALDVLDKKGGEE